MLGWTLSILRRLRCAYMWCRKSVHGLCGIIWGGWKGKIDLGCKKSWCSFIQLRGTCTEVFIFWPHKSKLTQKHPQEERHTNPGFSWTPDSERLSLLKICDSSVKHFKVFQSIFFSLFHIIIKMTWGSHEFLLGLAVALTCLVILPISWKHTGNQQQFYLCPPHNWQNTSEHNNSPFSWFFLSLLLSWGSCNWEWKTCSRSVTQIATPAFPPSYKWCFYKWSVVGKWEFDDPFDFCWFK